MRPVLHEQNTRFTHGFGYLERKTYGRWGQGWNNSGTTGLESFPLPFILPVSTFAWKQASLKTKMEKSPPRGFSGIGVGYCSLSSCGGHFLVSRKDSVPLTFTVGGRGSNCVLWLCLRGHPPPSPSSQHRRGGKFRICEGSILCPLGSLGGSNPITYQALDHNRGSRDFNPSSWIYLLLVFIAPQGCS